MGLFDLLKKTNINDAVAECRANGGVLLDVRTKEEYDAGHIEGTVNLPLACITQAESLFPDRGALLYVHCLSGARSAQAVSVLKEMGYENAANIGGISRWKGEII